MARIRALAESALPSERRQAKLLGAVIAHLAGAGAAIALIDEMGLSRQEALEAAATRAINVLIEGIKRNTNARVK